MAVDVDPNSWLMSGGVRSAKFEKPGDQVVGFIMHQPELQNQTDPGTGEVKLWNDGSPRKQMRVILMTEQRDPGDEDDSGERALYVRGNMQQAVRDAVRQIGASGLQVGGKLLIKYTGDGQRSRGGVNPPKLYSARYRPPEPVSVAVPEPPTAAQASAQAPDLDDEVPF